MRKRKGFMYMEFMAALVLISITIATVFAARVGTQRMLDRLANQRQAMRMAELALTSLQVGKEPEKAEEFSCTVRSCATTAPAGMRWVEVNVTYRRAPAQLIGLAPEVKP